MKKTKDCFIIICGSALLIAGFILVKKASFPNPAVAMLPYVMIGFGCGLFGYGLSRLLTHLAIRNAPEAKRAIRTEQNDERNQIISNRAKAKSFDLMLFVFGALLLSLALMKTELNIVVLLVCGYLFVCGCSLYYRYKYSREM